MKHLSILFATILLLNLGFLINIETVKAATVNNSGDVEIITGFYSCRLNIQVYPEKRIPRFNNWQNTIYVEIFSSSNQSLGTFQASTNNLGAANIDLCQLGFKLIGGNYTFAIKGLSHLRRVYPNVNTFFTKEVSVNLTNQPELQAGDTGIVVDNFINVMDITTQVAKIYTGDLKNDLNRDGQVNSLDISNTLTNYLLAGQ